MAEKKRILVAPLNWGLGHASRCVPIINELLSEGAEVIVAAEGNALKFLQMSFPNLQCIEFRGVNIKYPKHGALLLHFALRLPSLFKAVKNENQYLKKIVRQHKIDGVISDNRYGAFHKSKPSVIITHQLFIEAPIFKKTLQQIIRKMISRFAMCWVPDYKNNPNLSGNLAHLQSSPKYVKFIGPLSRFTQQAQSQNFSRKVLILLSGPEPQRSILEEKLYKELKDSDLSVLLVRGVLGGKNNEKYVHLGVETVDHLMGDELQKEILGSELIICRSGYSTIMDLVKLNKKALLIPTPGQTEQEYLADYLSENEWFSTTTQSKLDLSENIKKALLSGRNKFETNESSNNYIKEFLAMC